MAALIKIEKRSDFSMCSAFVINDTTAISAAHCTTAYMMNLPLVLPEHYTVYDSTGKDTGVVAETKYIVYHVDMLILKGDFKNFNKVVVKSETFDLKVGDDLYMCGFAGGIAPPTCTEGEFKGSLDFMGTTSAYVAKGMSGGPVIDRDGKAVGINSAKGGPLSIFGILFGNVKEK